MTSLNGRIDRLERELGGDGKRYEIDVHWADEPIPPCEEWAHVRRARTASASSSLGIRQVWAKGADGMTNQLSRIAALERTLGIGAARYEIHEPDTCPRHQDRGEPCRMAHGAGCRVKVIAAPSAITRIFFGWCAPCMGGE